MDPVDRRPGLRGRRRPLDPRGRPRRGPHRHAREPAGDRRHRRGRRRHVNVQAGGGVRDQASAEAAAGGGRRPGGDRHRRRREPPAGEAIWPPTTRWQSASTRGAGWRRSGAGPRARASTCSTSLARFEDSGVAAFVVTDIAATAPSPAPTSRAWPPCSRPPTVDVIASGGVGSAADLDCSGHASRSAGARLAGAIVGKALYDGRFTVEEAMAACAASG